MCEKYSCLNELSEAQTRTQAPVRRFDYNMSELFIGFVNFTVCISGCDAHVLVLIEKENIRNKFRPYTHMRKVRGFTKSQVYVYGFDG